MNQLLLLVLPLIVSALAIKVPVDYNDESAVTVNTTSSIPNKPLYYTENKDSVDSYLIPPDPHKPEEVLPDSVVTPATYLLPPSLDQQQPNYYAPTESGDQSDWYPIGQTTPEEQELKLLPPRNEMAPIPIFNMAPNDNSGILNVIQNNRTPKSFLFPIPSIKLEPPAENAQNDFTIRIPSEELELPSDEKYSRFKVPYSDNNLQLNGELPSLVTHLIPPKPLYKFKNPTKLYPKKFHGIFKTVPIPISPYADETPVELPKVKPAKYLRPIEGIESPILTPIDEKKIYQIQQAEEKRKFKNEDELSQETYEPTPDNYGDVSPTEQVVSETNFRQPGYQAYQARPSPAPLKQKAESSENVAQAPPAPDDRTEFRMHGMKGPHSYQFGYDTGKGKNRQFRYEERDNDGLVRGHYGYMDKFGKLRVVNYSAHPDYGFEAHPQEATKEE
ncbi:hypothetical protein ACJJTC_008857 [Scirpophaga incertulas]